MNLKPLIYTLLYVLISYNILPQPVQAYQISLNEHHLTRTIEEFKTSDTYTKQEINCLIKNVYFEARNESNLGKNAVIDVTFNRIKHKNYPNTICGVVYQYKQFSWYWDGLSDNPKNENALKKCEDFVYKILALKHYQILKGTTNGATHYHADYVTPYWSKHLTMVAKRDTHIFYI